MRLTKIANRPKVVLFCLLLTSLVAGCIILSFLGTPKEVVAGPCRGISEIGNRYITLTPPPEHVIIKPNAEGKDQVLATTSEGTIICRFTRFESPLEDVKTYWAPNKRKVIWSYGDQEPSETFPSLQLWLMNADGSHLFQIDAGLNPQNSDTPAWSVNGQRIAFSDHDYLGFWTTVYTIDADGTQRRQLTSTDIAGYGRDLTWSPTGKWLAFAVMDKAAMSNNATIYIIDADTGSFQKLFAGKPDIDIISPQWSPDSSKITYQVGHYVSNLGHFVYDTSCTTDINGKQEVCTSH